MPLDVGIDSLTFSDGTTVELRPSSVTVIVGPNNAGKSVALSEMMQAFSGHAGQRTHVVRTSVRKEGDETDFEDWLKRHAHAHPIPSSPQEERYSRPATGPQPLSSLKAGWHSGPPFGILGAFFATLAGGEQRLALTGSVPTYDLSNDSPSAPLQILYENADRERVLADAVREAFGVGVTVNRVAGGAIHLHLGEVDAEAGPPLVTNAKYREAINRLPLVHAQGDGMKSFVGLTLLVATGENPVVLVDEPEAFLHPPQARLLGRALSRATTRVRTQLVIATHSLDVLRGALDADAPLTVVRLRRDGDVNHARVLEPERVRDLWADPIIQFSNALDGLFHQGVVVCEGDGDARIYDAALRTSQQRRGDRDHGLLFIHCGGKARVPVVAEALRALDVPVRVVSDLDVLRDDVVRRILVALGGDWSAIENDWRVFKSAVESQGRRNPSVAAVRERITELLGATDEVQLTPALQEKVRELTRAEDPWQALKRAGVAAAPKGEATAALKRLDEKLRTMGLFLVPVGELEGWAADIGGHGPPWVVRFMEGRRHEQDGPLAEFVAALHDSVPSY